MAGLHKRHLAKSAVVAILFCAVCTAAARQAVGLRNTRNLRSAGLEESAGGYPIIALRNPVDRVVRVYGQFLTSVIGNSTGKGQTTQFEGCLMKGQNKEELVHNVQEVQQIIEFDEETTQRMLSYGNYYIDCHDPGSWADSVTIKLQNGLTLGRDLAITNMEGKRRGKLGVCSQSLHADVDWLKEWVDHQFLIGADEVILHAPQGTHIDDLFNSNRQTRLDFNAKLSRHARRHALDTPLARFERSNTVWQEYYASPSAQFHIEELIFTACHYRLRYAYDYTVQFDVDEFWVPGKNSEEKLLPAFLEKHMSPDAASIGFRQVLYPKECASRTKGNYIDRFTLRERLEREEKPAVRPINIDRVHIHGLLHASPEYLAKGLQHQDHHWAVPAEMALLKNIRWDATHADDGSVTYNRCEFGPALDPEETGLTLE